MARAEKLNHVSLPSEGVASNRSFLSNNSLPQQMTFIQTSNTRSELDAMIARAHARAEAEALAAPSIDPLPAFTKTHRVFVWTIMYLAEKHDVIGALRHHYADVCSGGDVCMHHLIDFLEGDTQDPSAVAALYTSNGIVKQYWEICWEYMRSTLKNWLDQGRFEPNPTWAD